MSCQHPKMIFAAARLFWLAFLAIALAASAQRANAAACEFDVQGEGRVAEILDARSIRLDDGREVRLVGIEPISADQTRQALASLLAGSSVMLRAEDDVPDRYGRQPALVFVAGATSSVQLALLAQGAAVVSSEIVDRDCAAALLGAEAEARRLGKGGWAGSYVIKNAESPDDILAGIGRFAIVEGKVLSVRQAGATTYLNFGRNWTRGFAVTISRRLLAALESAGIPPKSLENRQIRVRGWVEGRSGPRIELLRAGQIERLN